MINLESIKIAFVRSTRGIAVWWIGLCDEWMDDRTQKNVRQEELNAEMSGFFPLNIDKELKK